MNKKIINDKLIMVGGIMNDINLNNKENDNNIQDNNQIDNIYGNFVKENNVNGNNMGNTKDMNNNTNSNADEGYHYQEKVYNDNYLEEHTVVTRASKISRLVLVGFYAILLVVGVFVFFMLRADRYEFYLVNDSVNITSGSTYQVELTPKNIRYFDYLNYDYTIADTNVATVDEFGTITGVGEGTTTLTISMSPGFTNKKMIVNCKNVAVESIDLNVYNDSKVKKESSVSLKPNQTITLKSSVNGTNDTNVTANYSSSDTNVATVDEFGNVTTKSEGTATITGTRDGVSGQIVVDVKNNTLSPGSTTTIVKVTNVDIGTSQVTKYVDSTFALAPTITPSSASYSNISWTSSNTSVATVTSNGVVKTLSKGTAVITVSVDGIEDTCTVIVKEKESTTPTPTPSAPAGTQVSASEVTLSTTSLTVSNGSTATFSIKVSGAAGIISVSSSDTNVVKVSTSSSDCNGTKCFFDAQAGKETSIEFTVTGVSSNTAYINVSLDDLVSYDEKAITGSGKIGILVN